MTGPTKADELTVMFILGIAQKEREGVVLINKHTHMQLESTQRASSARQKTAGL